MMQPSFICANSRFEDDYGFTDILRRTG